MRTHLNIIDGMGVTKRLTLFGSDGMSEKAVPKWRKMELLGQKTPTLR